MEEDDVDLGHVKHPQRHRGGQAERDGQGGSLDIHLGRRETQREGESVRHRVIYHISSCQRCVIVQTQNTSDEGREEDRWDKVGKQEVKDCLTRAEFAGKCVQ